MIRVYGASDDLIEIEGDITEEFAVESGRKYYLAFSDGTLLSMHYDSDGLWRIWREWGGPAGCDIRQGSAVTDEHDSALLTNSIGDPIRWVVCSTAFASARP